MAAQPIISVAEARNIVREKITTLGTERVSILDAVGRVLAEDVYSDIDVAAFDDSAMDGFAVITADLEGASVDNPVQLECVGHIGAGSVYDNAVTPGQTVRIMTGALVPDGVDSVVKIEDVTFEGEGGVGDKITFSAPTKLDKNIRRAGQEAKAGEKIIEAGDVITPAGAGLLASCGNLEVVVYKRPVVGLISIGSELVDATEKPSRGMIRNSNIWAMQANVVAAGAIPKVYPTAIDDSAIIKETYEKAAAECDAVVSTGGACLGDFDLTAGVIEQIGTLFFQRVDVKPGKSQPFGEINGTPVFILSGNPAASSMGFELYTRLALRIMQGYTDTDRATVKAHITKDVRKKDPRMFLERAVLTTREDGEYEVTTMKNQSSALFGALQACNCLAVIPSGLDGVSKGDLVTCIITTVDESLPLHV